MTPARLDEISALADAATPGPWRALLSYSKTKGHLTMAHFIRPPKPGSNVEDIKAWKLDNVCDLMFVAAARTAVPELVAEVRRARAAASAARSTCGLPCPRHEHACARSPRHCGPCRDVKQKGSETCAWDAAPESTAPLAANLPHVAGRCPACGRASLFLGAGGYVTCAKADCPEPDAASGLLAKEA
jgi:hypothetical protein